MKALPQEQADKAKLELNFKYEYLKQEERTQVTSTEKLSVRYAQPDRFSLGDIQKEKEISANEETAISIPYVNKGKTTVSNVEARLKTEDGQRRKLINFWEMWRPAPAEPLIFS